MQIKEMKIGELIPYENNPRFNDNAVDAVANSIKEFGFKVPIVVDKNKVIIAGHTRLLASKKLGLEKVPVIFADDLSEEQVKAFRLADNKVGEIATWDLAKLNEELRKLQDYEVDMSEFGFDLTAIDNYEPTEDDFDVEATIQNITIPNSNRGDIYKLGNHRLMCGDSTNEADVKKLVGENQIDLFFTDPPYNVDYVGKTKDALKIENDRMNNSEFAEFLFKAFNNASNRLKMGGGILYLVRI